MTELRELLFGDLPLEQWAGTGGEVPWSWFAEAAGRLADGDPAGARSALTTVLAAPGLESRHYLQAWQALRALGVQPEALQVFGVVLDVPVPDGLDTLAAYADHSARYLNHSGAAIIWDAEDPTIGAAISQFLAAAKSVAEQTGPWEGARPPLPPGSARISVLCADGLHFGQAPVATLQADPIARDAFAAGTQLLVALVERADRRQ